jgi:Cu2+-exporting ATPase/Cu+-exporting ATPase
MSSKSSVQQTFSVEGMHCASCASVIGRELTKIEGITQASAFYGTEEARVTYDPVQVNLNQMNQRLLDLGYKLLTADGPTTEQQAPVDHLLAEKERIHFTLPLAIFTFALMIWEMVTMRFPSVPALPLPEPLWHLLQWLLASVIMLVLGKPFLLAIPRFLRFGKANMDTLIGLGTSVAYLYSLLALLFMSTFERWGLSTALYFDVTIVVIAFVRFGKYLESRSKQRTGEALSSLMKLQSKTAWRQSGEEFLEVPVEQVQVGDVLRIKPGSSMPVDGVIVSGEANVDESMLTGEAMPLHKLKNDQVVAGTINLDGLLLIKAVKVGQDTVLAKIVEMVKTAQNSKAPIERLADQISAWFVPIVLLIALLTLLIWLWFGSLAFAISCMIAVLVIACPCALGLATPTAMIVGVGAAAKRGILIKNAESLERLHQVTTVVFDKTGTLTSGHPSVTKVVSASKISEDDLLTLAASLEQNSEHPLAQAVLLHAADKKLNLKAVEKFHNLVGEGVEGRIDGRKYYLLSQSSAAKRQTLPDVLTKVLSNSESALYLLNEESVLGMISVADQLKKTSKEAVQNLRKLGIKQVLLSGDRQQVVDELAQDLDIKQAFGELAPADKLSYIKKLQQQGEIVAMVGDGINDAPALAIADVGIAMSSGTEVAMSTAAATILRGDLLKVETAIKLSKSVMRVVKENLFWAFAYNVLGIPLAAGAFYFTFGWLLNPAFAGMAMAFSSVSVVLNSLRLKWILK